MKNAAIWLAALIANFALAGAVLHSLPRAHAQESTCVRLCILDRSYDVTNNIVAMEWEGWIITGTETNVLRYDPNGWPIWQTILIDQRDEYVRYTNGIVREYVHRESREPLVKHALEGRIDPRTIITWWCEGD